MKKKIDLTLYELYSYTGLREQQPRNKTYPHACAFGEPARNLLYHGGIRGTKQRTLARIERDEKRKEKKKKCVMNDFAIYGLNSNHTVDFRSYWRKYLFL